jgi:hypothetical protein
MARNWCYFISDINPRKQIAKMVWRRRRKEKKLKDNVFCNCHQREWVNISLSKRHIWSLRGSSRFGKWEKRGNIVLETNDSELSDNKDQDKKTFKTILLQYRDSPSQKRCDFKIITMYVVTLAVRITELFAGQITISSLTYKIWKL